MQSRITPFPKKGHIDKVLPGQEDEATEDPDIDPWDVEDNEVENESDEELGAGNEYQFDPSDWHTSHIPDDVANPEQCDSDSIHGDGVGLRAEQADIVIEQSERIQAMQDAKRILASAGGPVTASLVDTVNRVMHMEMKRFNQQNRTDPAVQQEMKNLQDAEEEKFRQERAVLQEHMQQTRERDRVKRELAEATARLRKTRRLNREAEAVVVAREQFKAYSLDMMGDGKKKAGGGAMPQDPNGGYGPFAFSCRADAATDS